MRLQWGENQSEVVYELFSRDIYKTFNQDLKTNKSILSREILALYKSKCNFINVWTPSGDKTSQIWSYGSV